MNSCSRWRHREKNTRTKSGMRPSFTSSPKVWNIPSRKDALMRRRSLERHSKAMIVFNHIANTTSCFKICFRTIGFWFYWFWITISYQSCIKIAPGYPVVELPDPFAAISEARNDLVGAAHTSLVYIGLVQPSPEATPNPHANGDSSTARNRPEHHL